jgi:hypothetical protein
MTTLLKRKMMIDGQNHARGKKEKIGPRRAMDWKDGSEPTA